jgi:hypothetical protein
MQVNGNRHCVGQRPPSFFLNLLYSFKELVLHLLESLSVLGLGPAAGNTNRIKMVKTMWSKQESRVTLIFDELKQTVAGSPS